MGKKRSGQQEKDHLLKKLRKLEQRVRKLDESNYLSDSETQSNQPNPAEKGDILMPVTGSPVREEDVKNIPPELAVSDNTELPNNPVESELEAPQEDYLDDHVLEVLGAPPSVENEGIKLHKQIAQRWEIIFKKGLSKEEKDTVIKENPPFINFNQMKPPKLNPEVRVAVNELTRKRDQIIQIRQQQICTALSCLGSGLQMCVKDIQSQKMEVIKKLNDAARLLCDSLYLDTRGRRSILLSVINKDMKELLLQSEPDTYLFGEKLTEKIKAAKSVQQSGKELKVIGPEKRFTPRQNTMSSRPNPTKNNALNSRGPPHARAEGKKRLSTGGPSRRRAADKKREEKSQQRRK